MPKHGWEVWWTDPTWVGSESEGGDLQARTWFSKLGGRVSSKTPQEHTWQHYTGRGPRQRQRGRKSLHRGVVYTVDRNLAYGLWRCDDMLTSATSGEFSVGRKTEIRQSTYKSRAVWWEREAKTVEVWSRWCAPRGTTTVSVKPRLLRVIIHERLGQFVSATASSRPGHWWHLVAFSTPVFCAMRWVVCRGKWRLPQPQ